MPGSPRPGPPGSPPSPSCSTPRRGVPAPQRRARPPGAGPASLADQVRRVAAVRDVLAAEGWDHVEVVAGDGRPPHAWSQTATSTPGLCGWGPNGTVRTASGLRVVLQLSRFPWGEDPGAWVRDDGAGGRRGRLRRARADGPPDPDPAGRHGLAADPRAVGHARAGRRARHRPDARHAVHAGHVPPGRDHGEGGGHPRRALRRSRVPRRRRRAGGTASTRRTGSRSRPPASGSTSSSRRSRPAARSGRPGTKAYDGERVTLPETTSYPRPAHDIPVIVGGGGERRTLADRGPARRRLQPARRTPRCCAASSRVLDRHLAEAGRTRDDVAVTVLDLPVVGRDRDDAWAQVERLRGRTAAAAFARRTHAGTVDAAPRAVRRPAGRSA